MLRLCSAQAWAAPPSPQTAAVLCTQRCAILPGEWSGIAPETRQQIDPSLYSGQAFTGQRSEMEAFGLMYYNARWGACSEGTEETLR